MTVTTNPQYTGVFDQNSNLIVQSITTSADATIHGATVGTGSGSITSNTAVGTGALSANTTGSYNTANGQGALQVNTTGYSNTANGQAALNANTTGYTNAAVGQAALYSNTTGNNNTAAGNSALFSNATGNNNTATGQSAGSNTSTNTNSTFVGQNTQPLANSGDKEIVIGAGLIGRGSNTALIGGTSGVYTNGPIVSAGYTVATLPAGVQGMRAFVTDATSPTFLGALTGGGAVVTPVFFNGSAWVAG